MTLLQSSIDALRARVRYLRSDFEHWRERTEPSGDLRQHRSQVERITDVLSGSLEEALGETAVMQPDPLPPGTALGTLPDLRRDIGSVHLMWDYFRDKFAQRDVTSFETHLGCGDDLAWACYKPCLDAAVAADALSDQQVKEPPLVFYSTHPAPFAQARTKIFDPPGLTDPKAVERFAEVLMRLPVPVIGVPWTIAKRLPELVLVGHESGHVVAEDLGLADEARSAVEALALANDAQAQRKSAWLAWCDEIFADMFGVLATGSAFVAGLGAELADDVQETRTRSIDEQRPGKYPTPTLRMALCERALASLGVTPSPAWSAEYANLIGDSEAYGDDVDAVVGALLQRQWARLGGKRLTELLPWSQEREQDAAKVARAGLREQHSPVQFDVRLWIAAAMHAALADANSYAAKGLDTKLADFIVERRADAVRFSHARTMRAAMAAPGVSPQQAEVDRSNQDVEAGRRLYDLLKTLNVT